MTDQELALVRALDTKITALDATVHDLTDRITALEARPVGTIYRGIWQPNTLYLQYESVSDHGCSWVALQQNRDVRPSTTSPLALMFWQLCVKKGKDGRDCR